MMMVGVAAREPRAAEVVGEETGEVLTRVDDTGYQPRRAYEV